MTARHLGLEVCGISCITNLAAGISKAPLSHEEFKATADRVAEDFSGPAQSYDQQNDRNKEKKACRIALRQAFLWRQ